MSIITKKITYHKSKLHGLGVFALKKIAEGEAIEICPILLIPKEEIKQIDTTNIYNYYFSWKDQSAAIALGYGSLYNHSLTPNARYKTNYSSKRITFKAIKEIKKGEEITVNYNGDPKSQAKVWFEK